MAEVWVSPEGPQLTCPVVGNGSNSCGWGSFLQDPAGDNNATWWPRAASRFSAPGPTAGQAWIIFTRSKLPLQRFGDRTGLCAGLWISHLLISGEYHDSQLLPHGSPGSYHHRPAQALPLVIQLHGICKEEVEGQQELQQRHCEECGCRGHHIADESDERETLWGSQGESASSCLRNKGGSSWGAACPVLQL